MKAIFKSIFIAGLVFVAAMSQSCTKETAQDTPSPAKGGKVFITVSGRLGEFDSDNQTRSELASVVRVRWANDDIVYVYDGTTCLGSLTATVSDPEGRVAELSGDIDAPTGNVLSFIHSNILSSEPTVTDGKITIDLATQSLAKDKIPFVVYGFADYASTTVSNLVVPFQFATSAITFCASGLKPNGAITTATLEGVNTKCELTLGEGTVTATGTTPGSIVRNAGLGNANARGAAFIKLAVPVSGATSKTLSVHQTLSTKYDFDFSSNAITSGLSISMVNPLQTVPEYVDLGLSVKWATFNVGATSPEEYGEYFAWGEISPKYDYSWNTYKYCEGSAGTMTKYCFYVIDEHFDNKYAIEPEDDVAHVRWGGNWRMPNSTEMNQLSNSDNCTWTWYDSDNTEFGGITGYKVTSKKSGYEGNFIFLPAAGCRKGTDLTSVGEGMYWTSDLGHQRNSDDGGDDFSFSPNSHSISKYSSNRCYGLSVRPVCQ